jgi:hypothetical protein
MSAPPPLPGVQPFADQWSGADMDAHAQIGASAAPTSTFGGDPMYRFTMRITVLAALAAALVLAPATTASADPATVTKFDIQNFQVNTCNGETVLLTGTIVMVTQQEAGGKTVTQLSGQFTGTGSFGTEYVLSFRTQQFLVSDPFSFELTNTQLLVSKGSEPNQLVTMTVSFPPFMFNVETDCRG